MIPPQIMQIFAVEIKVIPGTPKGALREGIETAETHRLR